MEFLLNPCYRIEPDVCTAQSDESLGVTVFTRCVPPCGPVESADDPVGLCQIIVAMCPLEGKILCVA